MNPIAELERFESESARFDSLMPFRITNILLVSSLYDIYNLREDGQLADAEYWNPPESIRISTAR